MTEIPLTSDISRSPLQVAVITGGHPYDVPNFHRLFRNMPGIDCYLQHMNDFATTPQTVRNSYDAVVFYIFFQDEPCDDNVSWDVGQHRAALQALGETRQGIVMLHHAILAYPQWDAYKQIVGIPDVSFSYHQNQHIRVHIEDTAHPITAGLRDWEMTDETYGMASPGADSHLLLSVDHPNSMKTVAWTRQHKASRVFGLSLGHDNEAWQNESFQQVLRNGIVWSANKPS